MTGHRTFTHLPVEGPLAVVEVADAWLVVREECPDDWLALFEKSGGAESREGAWGLARLYNRRLAVSDRAEGGASDFTRPSRASG
jgi:hypothetical protein